MAEDGDGGLGGSLLLADNHLTRGVLELHAKGHGFLRDAKAQYRARPADPYVSAQLVGRYRLREGLLVEGAVGAGRHGGPRIVRPDRRTATPSSRKASSDSGVNMAWMVRSVAMISGMPEPRQR